MRVLALTELDPAQRVDWATRKAVELAAMRTAVSGRTMPNSGIDTLVSGYLADLKIGRAREATIKECRKSASHFAAWCKSVGITSARELTAERLAGLRAYLATVQGRKAAEGAKRGTRTDGGQRSMHTVNKDLRHAKAMLNHLRPQLRLSRDEIRDGLKQYRSERDEPDVLRPAAIKLLLRAAMEHDAKTFELTRDGRRDVPRYEAIAPFVLCVLLSGMRVNEALELQWADVDFDSHEIHLPASKVKTGKGRSIDLAVAPALWALLRCLHPAQHKREARVFPDLKLGVVVAARKRLVKSFDAPAFEWHGLRRTCGTFLTCAPSIFGAASVYMSARQLGHSVQVAEKHYLGRVKVGAEHRTLEGAMAISGTVWRVIVLRALLRVQGQTIAAGEVEVKRIVAEAAREVPKAAHKRLPT